VSARTADVSPIVFSLPSSNTAVADALAIDSREQPQHRSTVVADSSQSLASLPEPVGSSVPPPALASINPANRRSDIPHRNFGDGSCFDCGGDHHISVCQDCDPWEYRAPFFGSEEFGSGFYSIHVPEEDNYPVEQLNYAHITVEKV
jgi:hypothetical protein